MTDDLMMKRVAAKCIPRVVSDAYRAKRLRVCHELKEESEIDTDFLTKVITGDESWCYGYNPEANKQSSQWKTASPPRPKKARQVKSNVKTMMVCFFYTNKIVQH